jgi:hypothetical protein
MDRPCGCPLFWDVFQTEAERITELKQEGLQENATFLWCLFLRESERTGITVKQPMLLIMSKFHLPKRRC